MLTYDDALARILAQMTPLTPTDTPLSEALGRVLAEDVTTPFPLPPFANSSMDGFAVRAADVAAHPAVLPVAGDIAAGATTVPTLLPGQALRIMTGAPVPPGADAVVPIEDTEARDGGTTFLEAVTPGQCIRPAGEEAAAGNMVLRAGTVLRPAHIGMAATVGQGSLKTILRPRVAVLSTGDELVEPGQALAFGQIYNSNAYALAALVADAGGVVTHRLHARDTPESLRRAFDQAADADVLITSGGVSVGDYDHVKSVFAERGTVDFWRVAIRPGKPVAFGQWGGTHFFGLPGNPSSTMVTFELFVRPALRRLAGHTDLTRPQVTATLTEDARHTPGRQSYQRAVVTRPPGGAAQVRALTKQGSGMLLPMTEANALLVLPADTEALPAGAAVTVLVLD